MNTYSYPRIIDVGGTVGRIIAGDNVSLLLTEGELTNQLVMKYH